MPVIEVSGLTVRYGDLTAVDGLDLEADAGQVLALLGPNGAGKTSTVETLEGYRTATAGRVRVLGLDPGADHRRLRARMGVMLQRGGIYPALTPAHAVRLFARYYGRPLEEGPLLERVGLLHAASTPWRRLSGGEQQRLSLALALVGRPAVAFLDEPTAGVDPEGRRAVREVVAGLRDDGVCVLLTTHELDEAERMADRVAIIRRGRVVALGTPAELTGSGGDQIRFAGPRGVDVSGLGLTLGAAAREETPGEYVVATAPSPAAVAQVTAWLADRDLPIADLRAGRQRLEDVYLRLTAEPAETRATAEGTDTAGTAGTTTTTGTAGPAGPTTTAGRTDHRAEPTGGEESGAQTAGYTAGWWTTVTAQAGTELRLTLRRGDAVLLALAIPVGLLVFFSLVSVLPLPAGTHHAVDFLAPGMLALAVMSSGMVSLGIATGFERQQGVLKRLRATPLGRPALLAGKIAAVVAVEVLQVVVIGAVALALGWHLRGSVGAAVGALALGSVAFAGLGLALAGRLRAEVTLAAANGLYLVLLLVGGMVIPLGSLPPGLATVARGLPAAALSSLLHASLTGAGLPTGSWIALAVWAVVAPALAAATFRWE